MSVLNSVQLRVQETFYENGNIQTRKHYLGNKLHRLDGPAMERFNILGKRLIAEYWLNGKKSTKIVETYFANGNISERTYELKKEYHRLDGPAIEYFWDNGQAKTLVWRQNDLHHRADGPAIESFSYDGKLMYCEWFQNDKLHRINGPAHEGFNADGILSCRMWYQNGLHHRFDGPATEFYNEEGKRERVEYWLGDKRLLKSEHKRQVAILKLAANAQYVGGVSL